MNDSATSHDQLHDLAVPPEISWWPLAPGGYCVAAAIAIIALGIALRRWRHWRADAYRRAALGELARAQDLAAIAEILRRTALAVAPRRTIAASTGTAWGEWLSGQIDASMPAKVRSELVSGVYRHTAPDQDIDAARAYAAQWISHHRHQPC